MPLSLGQVELCRIQVGRAPWSARVPLDPLVADHYRVPAGRRGRRPRTWGLRLQLHAAWSNMAKPGGDMRLKFAPQAGLTLMEVLIAVSLLSLLSVGMLIAMRVGLSAMAKANARLIDDRRVAGAQRILEQEIAGFMPVKALCGGADTQAPK